MACRIFVLFLLFLLDLFDVAPANSHLFSWTPVLESGSFGKFVVILKYFAQQLDILTWRLGK